MRREGNCSCDVEKLQLGDIIVSPLQIADGAVLLASSACDLRCAVELFTAECEAARKRLSTFKSEVVGLSRIKVAHCVQMRGEQLYQVQELECLGVI